MSLNISTIANNVNRKFYLFDKNGLEFFYKGLLGAITFGAYNLWNINKIMKIQDETNKLHLKSQEEKFNNEIDFLKKQNIYLQEQINIFIKK